MLYKAKAGDTWKGALHPITYDARTINGTIIQMMKVSLLCHLP